MKILIVKLSAIGDVAQTLPALEALKNIYPDSEITWVVEEAAAGVLDGHPLIDRLLISRRKAWISSRTNPLALAQGLGSMVRFIRELRRTRYDIAIDFQGLLKSGIVIGLARADRKIGYDRTRELSYLFLNERLPAYDIERHALERYLDVARYLGASDPSPACTLPLEKEVSAVSKWVERDPRAGTAARSREPGRALEDETLAGGKVCGAGGPPDTGKKRCRDFHGKYR